MKLGVKMYKSNFLSEVILRVDFAQELTSLDDGIRTEVHQVCLKNFPVQSKKISTENYINISQDKQLETKVINKPEWHYVDINNEKEIIISQNCFLILYKKYINFNNAYNEFIEILKPLLSCYNVKINRIGLRYVDTIKIDIGSTFKDWRTYWKKYIASDLVYSLNFNNCSENLARCFNSIETNYSTHMLRFQYGIYNEDYPAKNKKPYFILDTDVYSMGLFEFNDIKEDLKAFHTKAKDWFESSITPLLRSKMGIYEE